MHSVCLKTANDHKQDVDVDVDGVYELRPTPLPASFNHFTI